MVWTVVLIDHYVFLNNHVWPTHATRLLCGARQDINIMLSEEEKTLEGLLINLAHTVLLKDPMFLSDLAFFHLPPCNAHF